MNQTWDENYAELPFKLRARDVPRVLWRGTLLGGVTFGCLLLLLLVRLLERPVFGQQRPVTPYITQFVCRSAFLILGIKHQTVGEIMIERGAVVANHVSWLDIFALNAAKRIYFVAKSEVAGWPGIGWLARSTGTVFIRRTVQDAAVQKEIFKGRLMDGHKLLFFPEGTSTDGLRVLPFKSTLFAAFFEDGLREVLWIQPVSVAYTAPDREDPRFYGWWGTSAFGPHLLKTLAAQSHGKVQVIYHAPLRVADFTDRKTLALAAEEVVREAVVARNTPMEAAD